MRWEQRCESRCEVEDIGMVVLAQVKMEGKSTRANDMKNKENGTIQNISYLKVS